MRENIRDNLNYRGVSEKIEPLLNAEEAFKRGAPHLYQELRRMVERGDPLSQTVMVRDFDAELRSDSKEPKLKPEKQVIGTIDGAGFLRARTLSNVLSERRRAFAMLANSLAQGTDNLKDRDLRSVVQSVIDADDAAKYAIESLRSAHRFFSAVNFENIINSDLKSVPELPKLDRNKFVFLDQMRRAVEHTVPAKIKLPVPPSIYAEIR